MMTIIKNGAVVSGNKLLKNHAVIINDSKIVSIGKKAAYKKGSIVIDVRGAFISPGFIDTHIHGEPGEIFSNEARYGTTAFVVAQSCASPGVISKKISSIKASRGSNIMGENLLGMRLEGPYINKKMAGAQGKRFIIMPSAKRIAKLIKKGGGAVKMITLAPELKGAAALVKTCLKCKVIPSIGHSDASYAEAQKAFSSGIRHVTHIFNAISGPRHGSAGASTAALFDDHVLVEVIADLKHVKIGLLRLLFALKDNNGIILITDSVRAKSSGHLVGSILTMIKAVENVVTCCGVDIVDAVNMASLNPARLFGVVHKKGTIAPGKDADIVVFDKNFDVKMTMIRGRIVYSKKGFICAG